MLGIGPSSWTNFAALDVSYDLDPRVEPRLVEGFTYYDDYHDLIWDVKAYALGDIDADGCSDLAITEPNSANSGFNGRVTIFSGADGSVIRRHLGEPLSSFGQSLCSLDDVDGDGCDDYGIASPDAVPSPAVAMATGAYGRVEFFSGSTGSLLDVFNAWDIDDRMLGLGSDTAVLGDVRCNGRVEVFCATKNGPNVVVSPLGLRQPDVLTSGESYFGREVSSLGHIGNALIAEGCDDFIGFVGGYPHYIGSSDGMHLLNSTIAMWPGSSAFPAGYIDADGVQDYGIKGRKGLLVVSGATQQVISRVWIAAYGQYEVSAMRSLLKDGSLGYVAVWLNTGAGGEVRFFELSTGAVAGRLQLGAEEYLVGAGFLSDRGRGGGEDFFVGVRSGNNLRLMILKGEDLFQ